MRQNNVIHVELNEPYQGKRNWYFGSVAAIYQELPKEVVGAGKDEHRTRKATIRRSKVITKQQKRC